MKDASPPPGLNSGLSMANPFASDNPFAVGEEANPFEAKRPGSIRRQNAQLADGRVLPQARSASTSTGIATANSDMNMSGGQQSVASGGFLSQMSGMGFHGSHASPVKHHWASNSNFLAKQTAQGGTSSAWEGAKINLDINPLPGPPQASKESSRSPASSTASPVPQGSTTGPSLHNGASVAHRPYSQLFEELGSAFPKSRPASAQSRGSETGQVSLARLAAGSSPPNFVPPSLLRTSSIDADNRTEQFINQAPFPQSLSMPTSPLISPGNRATFAELDLSYLEQLSRGPLPALLQPPISPELQPAADQPQAQAQASPASEPKQRHGGPGQGRQSEGGARERVPAGSPELRRRESPSEAEKLRGKVTAEGAAANGEGSGEDKRGALRPRGPAPSGSDKSEALGRKGQAEQGTAVDDRVVRGAEAGPAGVGGEQGRGGHKGEAGVAAEPDSAEGTLKSRRRRSPSIGPDELGDSSSARGSGPSLQGGAVSSIAEPKGGPAHSHSFPELPAYPPLSAGPLPRGQSAADVRLLKDSPAVAPRRGPYMPPSRGPIHPERPVSLDLRPMPRQIEFGADNKARALACTDSAVFALADDGLRVWHLAHAMEGGCDGSGNAAGDADAAAVAPLPVRGARALCLQVDPVRGMLWTGHADGAVRAWPISSRSVPCEIGDCVLEWLAHRQAVTAITITSYGELWTGAESGAMRFWPWESLARVLAEAPRGEGALAVSQALAGAGGDLKGRVLQGGHPVSGNLHSEVRFLVADRANGRVWSGGQHNVAIWDARQRELVKVVGPHSHFEFASLNRTGTGGREKGGEGAAAEDELARSAKLEEREKKKFWKTLSSAVGGAGRAVGGAVGGAVGAVGGAAEAVRRAAQGVEDGRRLGALAAAADGSVWGGFGSGLLLQWDRHGTRTQELQPSSEPVRALCAVGTRIWVGYGDKKIAVLSGKSGRRLGGWDAHGKGLVQLAACGDHVISLAAHGGLRAWSMTSPGATDGILKAAMAEGAEVYTEVMRVRVGAGTWNVGEERPSAETLHRWLGGVAQTADLLVVGLQEMEVGAGAIALAAAKDTVGLGLQEKGSANAHWWLSSLKAVLGGAFKQVAGRQLAGMLIGVWVRKTLLPHVGNVETGAVACGFGRALGNKGAVGVRMALFRCTVCLVGSHFAAHQEAVGRRNEDWLRIYQRMAFGRSMGHVGTAATSVARVAGAGVGAAVHGIVKVAQNAQRRSMSRLASAEEDDEELYEEEGAEGEEEEKPLAADGASYELADADLLVWLGDLNYRLDVPSQEEVVEAIRGRRWESLLKSDQLRLQMAEGLTFLGMKEAPLTFPPTYKFDKRKDGPLAYDSSEKKRVPAWCDRVLYRDSFEAEGPSASSASASASLTPSQGSLYRPVRATVVRYDSCMEATDSDHKPVRCVLEVELAVVNEAARRRLYGEILRSNAELRAAAGSAPPTAISSPRILLDSRRSALLRIQNESRDTPAIFTLHAEGQPTAESCQCGPEGHGQLTAGPVRPGGGLPLWLQVVPAAGVIPPREAASIEVRFERSAKDSQESWREEERHDKAAQLVLTVRGPQSAESTQQRICVCHGETASRLLRGGQSQHHAPPLTGRRSSLSPAPPERTKSQEALQDPGEGTSRSPPPAQSATLDKMASGPQSGPAGAPPLSPQPPSQPPTLPAVNREPLPDLLTWD